MLRKHECRSLKTRILLFQNYYSKPHTITHTISQNNTRNRYIIVNDFDIPEPILDTKPIQRLNRRFLSCKPHGKMLCKKEYI